MRDLDTLPVGDTAFASPSPAGLPEDTTLVDPSFTDTKAYTVPSLGGEFGPGGVPLLSGPADGGEAGLAATVTVIVTAPIKPTPASTLAGRSRNATIRNNLYPWFATPPAGLSSNRGPAPTSEDAPAEDPPVQMSALSFVGGLAAFGFSGRARADAVVHIHYVIGGDLRSLIIAIATNDTASSIAAAVRAALRTDNQLAVSGGGGQVSVAAVPTSSITDFEITIERD